MEAAPGGKIQESEPVPSARTSPSNTLAGSWPAVFDSVAPCGEARSSARHATRIVTARGSAAAVAVEDCVVSKRSRVPSTRYVQVELEMLDPKATLKNDLSLAYPREIRERRRRQPDVLRLITSRQGVARRRRRGAAHTTSSARTVRALARSKALVFLDNPRRLALIAPGRATVTPSAPPRDSDDVSSTRRASPPAADVERRRPVLPTGTCRPRSLGEASLLSRSPSARHQLNERVRDRGLNTRNQALGTE